MMRRTLTPAEMRERSEMCRRERQHLLRYAIWNSRRIREEREKAAAVHCSPTKQDDPASPKRLPLQPIHNTLDNSRLVGSSVDADCSDDESSDSSSSDADGDGLDDVVDSFSKLNSSFCPSSLVKSYAERLAAAEEVGSSSSSEDSDKLPEAVVGSSSSSDDVDRLSETDLVDCSSSDDEVERLPEAEEVDSSSSNDVKLSEAEEVECSSSGDDSDNSWSDCEDTDDGDGCSCSVVSAGRASGYSDKDLAVFFQRVSKRFNAMITSVHQTRV